MAQISATRQVINVTPENAHKTGAPALSLPTSRVVMPTRAGRIAVYGKVLPNCVRSAINVAASVRVEDGEAKLDIEAVRDAAEAHDDDHAEALRDSDDWRSVYVNGQFMAGDAIKELDFIEAAAKGGPLAAKALDAAAEAMAGVGDDVKVTTDCEPALDLQLRDKTVVTTVLERSPGSKSSVLLRSKKGEGSNRTVLSQLEIAAAILEATDIAASIEMLSQDDLDSGDAPDVDLTNVREKVDTLKARAETLVEKEKIDVKPSLPF